MKQTKTKTHSPLNSQKINTTRKIRKLKKIKKRKIKFPGAPLSKCFHGVKKMEDKIKKNEPNLGNNSFKNFNGDKKQLQEGNNIFNNISDNIITNKNDNNTNRTFNNMTLLDGNFCDNKGFLSLPIIVAVPAFCLPPNNINFEFLNDNNNFPNSSFHKNLEIENLNNKPFSRTLFRGDNRNEFLFENPSNNGSNISFYNINNSNRNEINPQSNNVNNNNQNNNQLNLRSNDNEFFFDYPRHRNSTNQSNNQLNLRSNDSEFYFDYPIHRNSNNQSNNQINLRSNDIEFYFDYPRQRNNTNQNNNQSNNQINLRSNDSEFYFDYPIHRNRNNPIPNSNLIPNTIENIKNKLTKIRFKKSSSFNENRESCIICYQDFKNNQNVYSLPCSHLFHIRCLNTEIKYRQKCPLCRAEL